MMSEHRTTSGFTLVELLLAASITSILVGALVAVLRTSFTLSDAVDAERTLRETAHVVTTRLREDVRAASIVSASDTALTLAHHTLGDTIRWTWPGMAGDPITRQQGIGATVIIADRADSVRFASTGLTRVVASETVVDRVSDVGVASFVGTDWSAHVDSTACDYGTLRYYRLNGDEWAAAEFVTPHYLTAITQASVRMISTGSLIPSVNPIIEVYRADPAADRPGSLYAYGSISRFTILSLEANHQVPLTIVDADPLGFAEPLWLVCRGSGGAGDYAGSVRVTSLIGCGHGDHPTDSNWFRESANAGFTWSARDRDVEMSFGVTGTYTTPTVVDTTVTLTNTTGLSYDILLSEGTHAIRRAGYFSE